MEEDVAGVAGGDGAGAGGDFVLELDDAAVGFADRCCDGDFVVVAGGGKIAAIGADDGEQKAFFEFHVAIADAGGAAIFGAADFHPDEIVGVVDDTHLVGFGVADAEAGLVGGHAREIIARGPRGTGSENGRNRGGAGRV